MRTVPEWQGKSDDEAVPPRVRRRIFDKHEGRCAICTRDLRSTDWDLDHLIPLAIGGRHAESNLRPLCADPCHSNKTVLDVKLNAYYNEIDPYAAQWLRNLISAGHIAPGDVDERSIVDVRPTISAATPKPFLRRHRRMVHCPPARRLARRPTCLDRLLPLPALLCRRRGQGGR
jgi:hypothetical protein